MCRYIQNKHSLGWYFRGKSVWIGITFVKSHAYVGKWLENHRRPASMCRHVTSADVTALAFDHPWTWADGWMVVWSPVCGPRAPGGGAAGVTRPQLQHAQLDTEHRKQRIIKLTFKFHLWQGKVPYQFNLTTLRSECQGNLRYYDQVKIQCK